MAGINFLKAAEFFKATGLSRYAPVELNSKLKNTIVMFEKKYLGEEAQIEKVVIHKNGLVQRGIFSEQGDLLSVVEESAQGRIDTNFTALNYDRVTDIENIQGEYMQRCGYGHQINPKRGRVSYGNSRGIGEPFLDKAGWDNLIARLVKQIRSNTKSV